MRFSASGNSLPLFQLPPSHEGEPTPASPTFSATDFNSRPRMRANGLSPRTEAGWRDFNSRPRMRANKAVDSMGTATLKFQLPPSHEGEHCSCLIWSAPAPFQLPPSHEGERVHCRARPQLADFNSRPRMRANDMPPCRPLS